MNTLDSVVDALAKDPARKFVVVEQVSTVQYLSSLLVVVYTACVAPPPILCFLVPTCPRPRRLQCLRALIRSQSFAVYLKEKGSQISGQKHTCTPLISLLEFEVFAIGDVRAEQYCTQF